MTEETGELLRRAADRGHPGNPTRLFNSAAARARRRRRANGAALVVMALVVTGVAAGVASRGRSNGETVTASLPAPLPSDQLSAVDLAFGGNIWPHAESDIDRSNSASVSAGLIAAVTGETPTSATPRSSDSSHAPTTVDVQLANGVTIDVFTAPEGIKGWRVLQVGASPSGSLKADIALRQGLVDGQSRVLLVFGAPLGAARATFFYATMAGTYELDLDPEGVARGEVVLPKVRATNGPPEMGAVVAVFRSADDSVVAIRGVDFG